MKKRIFGEEQEWGITVKLKGENAPWFFEYRQEKKKYFLENFLPPGMIPTSAAAPVFLFNGAKAHFDADHFEYATPEATSVKHLVQYSKAEEQIVEEAVRKANEVWSGEGIALRAFKNNLDITGDSWGTHENYLMLRSAFLNFPHFIPLTVSFLASRTIFTGNGQLALNEEENSFSYRISQKAEVINLFADEKATRPWPLVNTRDEPHADKDIYFRFHVTCGDALFSEFAQFLKYISMDMVLDAIEGGFLNSPVVRASEDEFLKALYKFSSDPELRAAANFDGEMHTAIDIQEMYCRLAEKFYQGGGGEFTPERKTGMKLWKKYLNLSRSPNPSEKLAPLSDWAAKRMLIQQKLGRYGCGWDAPLKKPVSRAGKKGKPKGKLGYELKTVCFQFHENSPKGLARMLFQSGFWKRMVSEKEVRKVKYAPLSDCRAHARSEQLKYIQGLGKRGFDLLGLSADWTFSVVGIAGHEDVAFKNLDPFDPDPKLPEKYPEPREIPTPLSSLDAPPGELPNIFLGL